MNCSLPDAASGPLLLVQNAVRYIKEKGKDTLMLDKIKRFILKKDENLDDVAQLISVIDSFRVGMGVDIESLRELVRTIRRTIKLENWPQIYKDMKYIQDLPLEKEPRIKLYTNIYVFLRYLVRQAFLIIGLLLFIFLLTTQLPLIKPQHLRYFLYGILAAAWCVVAVRAFVKDKLKVFYYTHQKEYSKQEERLQKAAQDLIFKMGKLLIEKGEPGKKYSFSMYQKDYKGIKILKKPGVLRDYYTIAVKKR
jgi:hypothetical protein